MTYYPRSAYGTGAGSNPNAGRPANGDRYAWGGYAWPNGVPASLLGATEGVSLAKQAIRVLVRREIAPLWDLLWRVALQHGYTVWAVNNGERWGPWGYENRAVSGTTTPSGHSMGLSVDINAPYNPYSSTFQSDMPPAMVADFEACGLYWGGRYQGQKYDPMHFGYCYPPGAVAGHMAEARAILGEHPTPTPPEDDMPLNDADKKWIKDTIISVLKSSDVTTIEVYDDKGVASNQPASVGEALHSAQVWAVRNYRQG